MLAAPDLPPNHGTVVVDVDSAKYLVDCAILHGEPLLLNGFEEVSVVTKHRRKRTGLRRHTLNVRPTAR